MELLSAPLLPAPDLARPHDVMLDLETMGTAPGFAIVAIGATKSDGLNIIDHFYTRVSLKSCVEYGLKIDPETVLWWLDQNDAARQEIRQPAPSLPEALLAFAAWYGPEPLPVWGNGATLDLSLTEAAYDAAKLKLPWGYREERCYRTLKNQTPQVEFPKDSAKVYHHALHDAQLQALHLMRIQEFQRTTMHQAAALASVRGLVSHAQDFGEITITTAEIARLTGMPGSTTKHPQLNLA